MDYCSNCGKEIEVFDKFCSNCGNQVKKSSMYESRSSYQQVKKKRKSKYGAARHGMASIFGSIALFLALLNFFSPFFSPVLSLIFAFAAIFISFKERRRDYYSQMGLIFAIISIAINILAFVIAAGSRLFIILF